ncbi:MAG TPA: ABC transporter permease [Kineosporiaceae bacterium]|nr:ABC transporter permease [Kineosporiaceae bacterium]
MMKPDGLRRTGVVARREIRERGRTKAFQISTVAAVLAVVAIIVLPTMLSSGPKTYRVGLAGVVATGMADALRAQAASNDAQVSITSYPSLPAAEQALRGDAVDVLLVDGTTLEWRQRPDAALAALVASSARAVRIQERAAQLGLSAKDLSGLLAPAALKERRLASPSGLGDNAQDVGMVVVILVFTAIALYGNVVLTGVAQEKSNRVAEVLLARIRPRELLVGKVIGIGALGLAQFTLIAASAAIALQTVRGAQIPRVPASVLAWLVVWFVLGYAFYSVVYAGLGALASRVEDASNAAAPVSVLLLAGYLAAIAAVGAPESTMTTVLSFLPPTAPFVMPLRLTLVVVPAWQVVASALLTGATVWLLLAAASRVYTGALLRTGARVPLRLAWRAGGQGA